MVYIDRDGRVLQARPWNLERILEIFIGLWFIIKQFFLTLLRPFMQDNADSNRSRRGGGGGSSWGGGGPGGGGGRGGGGGGGGNEGLRPNRRIGRIVNTMDCNIPGGG